MRDKGIDRLLGTVLRVIARVAAGVVLATAAEAVAETESAAYTRLLKAHVRPGTVKRAVA